jgi:RNA polymerase sigma-70 factor, ECF subfamily
MNQAMALSFTGPALVTPREEEAPLTFQAVYAHHFAGVWRTLRRLGVAEAQLDDAAQDVFVVVHRKLDDFAGGSVRAWLYAIAVRVASDYRRGAARRKITGLSHRLADSAPDPGLRSEVREAVRLLHELLSALDEKKRTVFVLSELEQLSVPEIAEALGVNTNTVYSRLRAARARFELALKRRRGGRP